MTVNCYPQDGKKKSLEICRAFAQGCGGSVITDNHWRPGPAMFYGISESNEGVWRQSKFGPFYYADNAFFDAVRGKFFRVGKNRLQHPGIGSSDGSRFKALGLELKPWRTRGTHILVTPQSDHFMRVAVGYRGSWVDDTVAAIRRYTDRPIVVREWQRDKVKLAQQLPEALKDCWALVTHSSGSAITALLSGIPVVTTAQCVISPMSGRIEDIDDLPLPEDREEWAAVVADQQWTLDEMREGLAWKALQ